MAASVIPGAYLVVGRHLGGASAERPPGDAPTVVLAPVVQGRWTAINSPTIKVPSHGTHGYAQTYAVDLLVEGDLNAPGSASGDLAGLDSFDVPMRSAVDGVVTGCSDGQRDHRNRRGTLGYLYLIPESMVRVFGGMTRVLGNYVVVRADLTLSGPPKNPAKQVANLLPRRDAAHNSKE